MTNPALSIKTDDEIGRLYQLPDGGYSPEISRDEAILGLNQMKLFPSITNAIDSLNPRMEGYVSHVTKRKYAETGSIEDAVKEPLAYLEATGARGTRVHKYCEDFIAAGYTTPLQGQSLDAYADCEAHDEEWNDLGYIKGFHKFLDYNLPEFIMQEATVYGYANGLPYAGTTDFIARIGGRTVVGDWKTTSKLRATVGMQLAAVAHAKKITSDFVTLDDMIYVDEAWGVQLRHFGSFKLGKVKDVPTAFNLFSSALHLWRLKAGIDSTLR